MKDGFFKAAAVVPQVRVADPVYNADRIIEGARRAAENGARLVVFPELAVTGYTCNDLFLQDALLVGAERELARIARETKDCHALILVGCPLARGGSLYNVAAVLYEGQVLAFIPKRFIPNYAEFYEIRQFTPGPVQPVMISFEGRQVPLGSHILLDVDGVRDLTLAVEICEDAWVPNAPDIEHALAGANVICNLSASNETVGKDAYRRQLVSSISARTISDYIYVSSGDGESTQDIVFGGSVLICENGSMLSQEKIFDQSYGQEKICYADLDIARMNYERRRMTTFQPHEAQPFVSTGYRGESEALFSSASSLEGHGVYHGTDGTFDHPSAGFSRDGYLHITVHMAAEEVRLDRIFDPHPFVPQDKFRRDERCNDILNIQSRGLAKRLQHIGCQCAVIGVSGGLDSTLALLVAARAFDLAGISREHILAVTMPCFGTTNRTYQNACTLAKVLGTTLQEVNIEKAVLQHFADIGQDPQVHDVTYENGQARERTQVLMDLANKNNGIVIGTGDLSELALGWATYNGDHMSMYGVNCGVPKTLVSHLVRFFADTTADQQLAATLRDVLDTPVSPELLPPTGEGQISQKTEDLVGPYELHDYFLYYMLRCGYGPAKIYRIAQDSFRGKYEAGVILKWEKTFYRRFFAQQFKRSCLPDGPKVGSVAVSPRGDLRMPSDASRNLWMAELETLG